MTKLLSREGWIWLGVAFVIGFCGWYKNINLMLLMAYMMAGIVLVNYWFALRQVARVSAKRIDVLPAFSGETFTSTAEIKNNSLGSATVHISTELQQQKAFWFLPQLKPNDSRKTTSEWRVDQRGVFETTPLIARSGDPFGLIYCTKEVLESQKVVVLPKIGHADLHGLRRWLIRTGAGDANTRRPVRRPGLHYADVRGVRGYRPGDQIRDIHWRTSAKRDELTVREYDSAEPLDLILVLDPWLPANATSEQKERLEWAISAVATVCWAWAEADEIADVTLIIPGVSQPVQTIPGTKDKIRKALSPLAEVAGSETFPALPADAFRRRSNRCARLLITTRQNSPMIQLVRSQSGVPFVPFDPTIQTSWYKPPVM